MVGFISSRDLQIPSLRRGNYVNSFRLSRVRLGTRGGQAASGLSVHKVADRVSISYLADLIIRRRGRQSAADADYHVTSFPGVRKNFFAKAN